MKKIIDLGKIGITLAGEYNDKAVYEKLTIVLRNGKSYISKTENKGVLPETDTAQKNWQLVAEAKDAYHMLVDAGKTTLTEEEFLEQLVDATKGRYIVQGNIINEADEEDLTVEHSDLLGIDTLKLANRDNTNGMGYVILRKNKSFAEQVIEENTIYEIRYDFDLNGAEVTIPNNCVLKFNGGSILNGKIISSDLKIKTNSNRIFNNVTFGGSCITSTICELAWFINKYPESDNDYSIDNTNEVKACFASGFRNIKFPNKYIHLTDTITTHKVINIFTEEIKTNYNWQIHPTYKKNSRPCIFSDNIVTLFDYQIDSKYEDEDYVYTSSLYIGNINCFIKKQFNTVDDINIPVINITPITDLWGVVIDANITAVRCYFTINDHTGFYYNYTGIKIATSSNTGYCSFVRINGNLSGLNYGVYLHGEPFDTSGWFTDVIITGDTRCCFGGYFDKVSPITIYGHHQSSTLSHLQVNPEGYFTGSHIKLYGFVWDCGHLDEDSGFHTAKVPVKLIEQVDNSFIGYPKLNIDHYSSYPDFYTASVEPLNIYKHPMQNALYRALAPRNDNYWFIPVLDYTVDDVSILKNYPNLKNADNLFNDTAISDGVARYRIYKNEAYIDNVANKVVKLHFEVFDSNMICNNSEGDLPKYLLWSYACSDVSISVNVYNIIEGEKVYYYSYNGTGSYYKGRLNVVRFPNISSFKVEIICTTSLFSMLLPTVIVPFYGSIDKYTISSNTIDKPNFNTQERHGCQCFDLQSKVLNIWDGNNWYNSLGIKTSVKNYGTFANKPNSSDIPIGFRYFCIDKQTVEGATNGIEIIHKGNDIWCDALGRIIS